MKKQLVAICLIGMLSAVLVGCAGTSESEGESLGPAPSSNEAEQPSEPEKAEDAADEPADQPADQGLDFETGPGLPSYGQLSDYFKSVAGMTLEAKKDGTIDIFGYRTGDKIGEIHFGGDGDDYDVMLIIDKSAGDREEGDASYCLKNALASLLRVYNGYDIDDPFDTAWDIIEYGTQSPYTYGMEKYLVGNVNGGKSYAVKVSGLN